MMNIEDFIEKIVQNCAQRGLEKYQIIYSASQSDSLSVFEQKVLKNSSSNSLSLSLSVIVNGKVGRFSTNKFDDNDIFMIVKNAIINAEVINDTDESFLHDGSGEYVDVSSYCPMVAELEKLDKFAYLKDLEKQAYDLDKRVNKVISTGYSFSKSMMIMRNSLGLNLKKENISSFASIYLSVKKDEETKTYSSFVDFRKLEEFAPKYLAEKTVKEAVKKLGSVDIASQKTKVIFNNEMFANFLDSIVGIFSSYSVDRGFSKLKGKMGQIVASPKVNIIDNPHLENGYATTSFDGEGFPTKYKKVVENGVLKTFLYNLSMANKYKTSSTGNGSGGLGVRTFNFYLDKGNISEIELIKKLGNGVYIDDISGIHAGLEIVSGDFSFGAEGFLVEEGNITKPLNQFTISGNLYKVLEDIVEIADNLEFVGDPVGSPSVLVDNITIAND